MALADLPRVERSYLAGDFADVAYRVQFCSEKVIKGILLMYGIQFKKYHEVSAIVENELLSNPDLEKNEIHFIEEIARLSKEIEVISTTPRYGSVVADTFTSPEHLFDASNTRDFTMKLIDELDAFVNLLEIKDPQNWQEIMEGCTSARNSLQHLVD
jgi:HEPN domain-containing protein